MNIAVIAAHGRSGKAFVAHALAQGHSVKAGIRGDNTFAVHPQLVVQECDALTQESVSSLISGQDAVVSLIGHTKNSQPHVQTEAMKILIPLMEQKWITRLVSLTGTGVRFPGDSITFMDMFMNMGIAFLDKPRIQDGQDHVDLIKKSQLDWTIVRVLKLTDAKPTPFTLTKNGPAKTFTSREEVARAILQVLDQGTFVKEAPIVSPA